MHTSYWQLNTNQPEDPTQAVAPVFFSLTTEDRVEVRNGEDIKMSRTLSAKAIHPKMAEAVRCQLVRGSAPSQFGELPELSGDMLEVEADNTALQAASEAKQLVQL